MVIVIENKACRWELRGAAIFSHTHPLHGGRFYKVRALCSFKSAAYEPREVDLICEEDELLAAGVVLS